MMIVDAQIHLWSKGTPSAHHRQTPFLHEEALAMMDAAGVDRAVVHPVMWDPDSNELAVEAARAHPDRFAIMGWMYLDRPEQRALLDTWKCRPGMKGLRFYFSDPQSVAYLLAADKSPRLTCRPSQGQKGLDEGVLLASQWFSHSW